MSLPQPIEPGQPGCTRYCATCGRAFIRRVMSTKQRWCEKCADERRKESNRRSFKRWSDSKGATWRQRRREIANQPLSTPADNYDENHPDYVVPGPERIAQIESHCDVCHLTYWTLDAGKRAARRCERCA